MKNFHKSWKKFINEVTDEELEDISDALHDIKYEDLSFQNVFGDKTRLITPLPVKDEKFEALKNVLNQNGYIPDFSTGLASYYEAYLPERPGRKAIRKIMMPSQVEGLDFSDENVKKSIRKKQVKIGKLLQKGARLFKNTQAAAEEFNSVGPTDFPAGEYADYRKASMDLEGKMDKEQKKLNDVFHLSFKANPGSLNIYAELATWWNKNSTYYRENPDAAELGGLSDKYSIILSRHPIDVLRMSDFDDIQSCHSPKSRGGDASYYKCAVAEAHGHGIIAYVVENENLEAAKKTHDEEDGANMSNEEFLADLDLNETELFWDGERAEGFIEPLSRVRLRKFVNPSLDLQLAVPEARIYGQKFPSLAKTITKWARTAQKDTIDKIMDSKNAEDPALSAFVQDPDPNHSRALDLYKWERHGGSYSDTRSEDLMRNLLNIPVMGTPKIDTSTEANLSLSSSVTDQWAEEVEAISERYNQRYQASYVDGTVEDDGGDHVYIAASAEAFIYIDEAKLLKSAFNDETRKAIDQIPDVLNDWGYTWAEDGWATYDVINKTHRLWNSLPRWYHNNAESWLRISLPVNLEYIGNGEQIAYDPEGYEQLCDAVDNEVDDVHDAVTEVVQHHLKREGILEGGAILELAVNLDEMSLDEWDYEIDDEHNPTVITMDCWINVDFEDLQRGIPVNFEEKPGSNEIFAMHDTDPIALVTKIKGGDKDPDTYEVRSPEFMKDTYVNIPSLEAVKELIQTEITVMILRPKGSSNTPLGYESSHRYRAEVWDIVKASLTENVALARAEGIPISQVEFSYPDRTLRASGPSKLDEYRMTVRLEVTQDDPDDVVWNAFQIVQGTDDEEQWQEIYSTAFKKVAKADPQMSLPLKELKNRFAKFMKK
jgi:hypothetical protein